MVNLDSASDFQGAVKARVRLTLSAAAMGVTFRLWSVSLKPSQRSFFWSHHWLLIFGALVLAGKILLFFVDPMPLFYMGDSGTFIESAIEGFIPAHRSFVYGRIIRWLSLGPHTLTTLIVAQVIASAMTAWLLVFALACFFRVRPLIAMTAGLIFALDPLQILHERMVLTEAFTNLIFALNLLLGFAYVRRPRVSTVVALCINGILLVSMRTVYVPVVIAEAVFVPILAWCFSPNCSIWTKRFAIHLSLSVLSTAILHGAYCYYVGKIGGVTPTYLYADGFFMSASWAPLLTPEDAPDPRAANVIERQSRDAVYPLSLRDIRWAQLWRPEGLANRLLEAFGGNQYLANQIAKRTSWRAFRRNPISVAKLTWLNFWDYWKRPSYVRRSLHEEQGSAYPPTASFLEQIATRFGSEAASANAVMSPSKRYHLAFAAWNYILLTVPLSCLIAVWLTDSESRRAAILMFAVILLLFLATCAGAVVSSYRFLHPFSFPCMASFAIIAEAMRRSSSIPA